MLLFAVWAAAALALLAQPLPRLAHAGFSLGIENGALIVTQVRPNGNAAAAGVEAGDIILTLDGATAVADTAFARSILRRADGGAAVLGLRRGTAVLERKIRYAAPPKENPAGIEVIYGSLDTGAHRRRTLLTRMPGSARPPVVLWLAGSGCTSQESPSGSSAEVQMLYALTRAGYATLRVEKTGIGDSEGPACYGPQGDLRQEVEAYAAAVRELRPARIFLLGHSAGATVAPLVLQAAGPVAGVVAAGGMGTGFAEYVLEMRERAYRLAGANVAEEMAITRRCLHALLQEERTPDDIEQAMPDCRRRVRFDSPPAYIFQWAKLDIAAAWRDAPRIPVLVLYGTGDTVSSLHQSRKLAGVIPRARLRMLPMDHDFQAYATPGDSFAAERGRPPFPPRLQSAAVNVIVQFFRRCR